MALNEFIFSYEFFLFVNIFFSDIIHICIYVCIYNSDKHFKLAKKLNLFIGLNAIIGQKSNKKNSYIWKQFLKVIKNFPIYNMKTTFSRKIFILYDVQTLMIDYCLYLQKAILKLWNGRIFTYYLVIRHCWLMIWWNIPYTYAFYVHIYVNHSLYAYLLCWK